jgi:hypothetical protein
MRLLASLIVKLFAPFAGIGAFAWVVATAWLLLPEAAAVPPLIGALGVVVVCA